MNLVLRKARRADLPFMQEMLYKAVFWRARANKPSLEEGLALPEVRSALAGWGERGGDTGVIATVDSVPAGAAWFRFWTKDPLIRGYVDETIPVLAIGVHRDYRRRGIGSRMIEWLVDRASRRGIHHISLMVAQDNVALNLYRQQGFVEYADTGDDFVMVRQVESRPG